MTERERWRRAAYYACTPDERGDMPGHVVRAADAAVRVVLEHLRDGFDQRGKQSSARTGEYLGWNGARDEVSDLLDELADRGLDA